MAGYERFIALAQRMIASKGQSVTFRQITDGAGVDASKPWLPTAATTVDHAVSVVFFPANRQGREVLHLMGDTEVPTGMLLGLMAAQSFAPKLKDVIVRAGRVLTVEFIDEVAPNGDVVVYRMGLTQ